MGARVVIVTDDLRMLDPVLADKLRVKGLRFQSKKEARRWIHLSLLFRAGLIRALRRQVRIPLSTCTVSGHRSVVGRMVLDFAYDDHDPHDPPDTWRQIYEDVKGALRHEDLYTWKKRHLRLEHGIEIREV